MSLSRYGRTVRLALKRVGHPVTVYRETGTTKNGYGKQDGGWDNPEKVGTWDGFQSYNYRSDRPEQEFTGAGERDVDTPVFIMPTDADVQNGDRLEVKGVRFEITSDPVEYDTHYEIRTTEVTN